MNIDSVSEDLVKAALYLDKKIPGSVSEIWLEKDLVEIFKKDLPSDIEKHLEITQQEIELLWDQRRKRYLSLVLQAIRYQLDDTSSNFSYQSFSRNTFGFEIRRVDVPQLADLERKIQEIEKEIGQSRFDFFQKNFLDSSKYQGIFELEVERAKERLPKFVTNFPDQGFIFETTTNQPWSAFNSHIAPYKSKLTINTDIELTKLDLARLASHEAYGGHHSELSLKDQLLVEEAKGEHGLVVTFSPQTFVSEAIAEGMFYLFGLLNKEDPQQMLSWYYGRLIFALQNLATFLYFEDKLSKEEIVKEVSTYGLTDSAVQALVNFSTDSVFGKYAPVYYSAFNFIVDLYTQTSQKEELIERLFTHPCTPNLLLEEFIGSTQ